MAFRQNVIKESEGEEVVQTHIISEADLDPIRSARLARRAREGDKEAEKQLKEAMEIRTVKYEEDEE